MAYSVKLCVRLITCLLDFFAVLAVAQSLGGLLRRYAPRNDRWALLAMTGGRSSRTQSVSTRPLPARSKIRQFPPGFQPHRHRRRRQRMRDQKTLCLINAERLYLAPQRHGLNPLG